SNDERPAEIGLPISDYNFPSRLQPTWRPSPFEGRGACHRAGHYGPDPVAATSGGRNPLQPTSLKLYPTRAVPPEHAPRFVRRSVFAAEVRRDPEVRGALLGRPVGELAGDDIERILKPHSPIAADRRSRCAEIHLMAAAGGHRPKIVVPEQPVGGALHEEQ